MSNTTLPDTLSTDGQAFEDMEFLRALARRRGADDAVIVAADEVILDPRVRFKCMIPRCYMSGNCSHCPPHGYSLPETRGILAGHEQAIFFRVGVKNSIIAAADVHLAIESGVMDPRGNAMNLGGHYILTFTIVKILQAHAAAKGYRTHGFAAGNCRDPFCHLRPVCRNLMTGRGCRHPNLSSHSMESAGMDVYTMAARVGWRQYPIGASCRPESVPRGNLMGLVLVGPKEDRVLPKVSVRAITDVKKQPSVRRRNIRRNIQALRQANMTGLQMLRMLKEPLLWLRVTRNFREIEGSLRKAMALYLYMFEGVPDKQKPLNPFAGRPSGTVASDDAPPRRRI